MLVAGTTGRLGANGSDWRTRLLFSSSIVQGLAVLSHHPLQRLKPSGKYSLTAALVGGDCLEYQKVNRERSGC